MLMLGVALSASAQTPTTDLKAKFEKRVQEIAGRVDASSATRLSI
jgi:hypothetical protein